jgi:hypothetical protein
VLAPFRRPAGICLIALLIGMFVANVNAARQGSHFARKAANATLVACSDAGFVYRSPGVVDSYLTKPVTGCLARGQM